LEAFDRRIPGLWEVLGPGDLAIITADHGNDPTWRGSDHTREHVPILAFGRDTPRGALGRRETLADIAATIAAHLGVPGTPHGRSWL
jgi:phosphopentomutase